MSQEPAKPRKPRLGGYTPWTDDELDDLSQITPADIERAKASVAPETRRLLEAEEDDDAES